MKILGIDSSGLVASVAVTEDGILLGEFTTNFKKTHSQTLLPMLDELKQVLDLDLATIDAIAVAAGPGSFTGLRIGASTAKGLGLALEKPVIAVPTVDALAYNLWGAGPDVCPLMDARRNQTYTGLYRFAEGKMQTIIPQEAVDVSEIISEVNSRCQEVIFLGDGVPVFASQIAEQCRVPYTFAPAHRSHQQAASVCALAEVLAQEALSQGQQLSSPDEFRPTYLRMAQAERERMERQQEV